MFSTYEAAINFLYQNLPMFQRIGAAALKPDLGNTRLLLEALGNPHHHFKSVHVAGTNGKGSTSHMIASVLQSAGYKTGLFTSPHLKEFTERIRVNGEVAAKAYVVDFVNRMQPAIEKVQPSFFEMTVAMAFDYFAQQQIEIAVVEVGLGGRLDSTNVITPEVSVITNIGWDHKEILGDTLEKIAFEKAGIIKHDVPVVISERQAGIDDVFIAKANEVQTTIQFATDVWKAEQYERSGIVALKIFHDNAAILEDLVLPLQGYYQQKNIAGVLATIDVLRLKGWHINDSQLRFGLENTVTSTGLKGRWQKLGDKPLMICDTGHNVNGIEEIVRQIRQQSFEKLHFVLGMVKDKDITAVLALLPKDAKYYFCQANIPRAMDASLLSQQAGDAGLTGVVIPDVNEAIRAAKASAATSDLIFIGGSTFVVAEIAEL